MEILYVIVGIIVGIAIHKVFDIFTSIVGLIEVDHNTGLCNIRITSDELSDVKNKKAIFKLNHNAIISREEQ